MIFKKLKFASIHTFASKNTIALGHPRGQIRAEKDKNCPSL